MLVYTKIITYSSINVPNINFLFQFCTCIVKCAIGATNALIPTFTALQYPTTMRTLSVGVGNFAAGFALITVPYLWLLVSNILFNI